MFLSQQQFRLPFAQVKANVSTTSSKPPNQKSITKLSLATCPAPVLKLTPRRAPEDAQPSASTFSGKRSLSPTDPNQRGIGIGACEPCAKRQRTSPSQECFVLLQESFSGFSFATFLFFFLQKLSTPLGPAPMDTSVETLPIDRSSSSCSSSCSSSQPAGSARLSCWQLSVQSFEFLSVLGKGRFGEVWVAKEKQSGLLVAIKKIHKQLVEELGAAKQLRNELDVQSNIRHVNLLRVFACFQDEEHIFVVLEYCACGDLYQRIVEQGRLSHSETATHIASIIHGLQYLHSKHVIHRDLKPENLLIDQRGTLKVADFGSSSHTQLFKSKRFCGTLDYLAPELVRGDVYDEKVDLWAVGVLCYEMLVGRPPFQESGFTATTSNIECLNYEFPDGFCPLAQDFISKILVLDPKQRLSLQQMLAHPWMRKNREEDRFEARAIDFS